jgi:NAD+ synthase (glutamine-hydrolysing)
MNSRQIVLFPELTLSGYPPEDLLFHRGLRLQIEQALIELHAGGARDRCDGRLFPEYAEGQIYNCGLLIYGGRELARHRKACLPNYRVFDEKRYFTPGTQATVLDLSGLSARAADLRGRVGVRCRSLPQRSGCAGMLMIINASPYEIHKQREREQVLADRMREVGLPAAYVNLLGGQDELVFDGNSFAMDAQRRSRCARTPFEEGLYCVEFARRGASLRAARGQHRARVSDEQSIYRALVLGVRDYVTKHGFPAP